LVSLARANHGQADRLERRDIRAFQPSRNAAKRVILNSSLANDTSRLTPGPFADSRGECALARVAALCLALLGVAVTFTYITVQAT
jgi:hypothetical protein